MKTKEKIGAAVAIVGALLAVCTQDGCQLELVSRGVGIALMTGGLLIGRWFDFQRRTEP